MEEIVKIVADYYGIYYRNVFRETRKREIVRVRQISMYIIRSFDMYSFPEIGRFFQKDHSTVMASVKVVKNDIETNLIIKQDVSFLIKQVEHQKLQPSKKFSFCNALPIMFFTNPKIHGL